MSHERFGRLVPMLIAVAVSVTGALAQQARMYGTVVDEQGRAVANAKVVLEPL